ncbi:PA2817 family protein [Dasania marina]|uniref:PA2817 family protein n=1 Tax=Dasania marina TaxID=471499 RepID=UPI00036EB3DA|nr:PA2817 family protein [Dasania marina]
MPENSLIIKNLFSTLYKYCAVLPPFCNDELSESEQNFINNLEQLANNSLNDEALYEKGQRLIENIIANYPMLTPALNRDILWLLGGNCMHYLGDDELSDYQRIDELLHEAHDNDTPLSFQEAKAQVLKLH